MARLLQFVRCVGPSGPAILVKQKGLSETDGWMMETTTIELVSRDRQPGGKMAMRVRFAALLPIASREFLTSFTKGTVSGR